MRKVIFFVVTLAIVGGYLQLVAARELKVIALALAILVVIALALTLFVFGWLAIEKVKIRRAERIEREREAHVKIVTAGSQVFIRDTDHRAYWRAAHLDPRFYANGQYSEPTRTEVDAWRAFNSPKVIKEQAAAMLPAQIQVDLLAVLDSVQRCLIVGASDSGKTTLLQWLVSRRLNTSRVIVIDPHAYPQKWPTGAHVTGTGRNYPEIDRALSALVQLMTKRYDEIGRGLVAEMAHSRITILIDEWRAITGNLGNSASDAIKALLTESRKAAFSVFVASHSDRAKPLGLEGEYDLKDGFAVVRLSAVDGKRTATIDTGNGPVPAVLPGPFAGSQPQVIDGRQWHIVGDNINLEPEPDETEAKILEMLERDESLKNITETVWGPGKFGKFYNDKVEQVKQKYT